MNKTFTKWREPFPRQYAILQQNHGIGLTFRHLFKNQYICLKKEGIIAL
jgi:hypothetical protein